MVWSKLCRNRKFLIACSQNVFILFHRTSQNAYLDHATAYLAQTGLVTARRMKRLVHLETSIRNTFLPLLMVFGQPSQYSYGWRTGRPGLDFRQGKHIFLYSTASRQPLAPTQPPTQSGMGTDYPGLQRPEREADHSIPSRAWVKNSRAMPPLPVSLHGDVLS
jgi:hypothetical protein